MWLLNITRALNERIDLRHYGVLCNATDHPSLKLLRISEQTVRSAPVIMGIDRAGMHV